MTYCDIIADILESYGFSTHIAYSANEALTILENIIPDLVLLDVMMPEIDGLTVVRSIRDNPAWVEIPVVVASAKVLTEDRTAALEAGADAFLAKPFSAHELRAALRPYVSVPDTGNLAYSLFSN